MQTILDGSMKNDYPLMIQQAEALTADERLVLPNLANTAALLGESLSEINWAGYYLLREGVLKENITVSGLCTMCRPQMFFSHRATAGKRGSNAGFLMLGEVSE